jgi:hypothetical protein
VPPREKTGRDRGGECLFAQASSPIVAESPIDSEFQFIIESGLQRSDFLSFSRGIFFLHLCSFRFQRLRVQFQREEEGSRWNGEVGWVVSCRVCP